MERATKQPRPRNNSNKRFGGVSNSKEARQQRAIAMMREDSKIGDITGLRRESFGATMIQGFWKTVEGAGETPVRKVNRLKVSKQTRARHARNKKRGR